MKQSESVNKYRIVLEAYGTDEDDALETAGHYLNIGYGDRVLISIQKLNKEEEQNDRNTQNNTS